MRHIAQFFKVVIVHTSPLPTSRVRDNKGAKESTDTMSNIDQADKHPPIAIRLADAGLLVAVLAYTALAYYTLVAVH